jgi:dipeptidyl aminopeptidase/acylaminoacyl peptidase
MRGPAIAIGTAALALAAPASARLVAYESYSCDQGGGEPHPGFFGEPQCARSIWVANVDGSSPRRVTNGPDGNGDLAPVWSPDGTTILFERQVESTGRFGSPLRLWSVHPDGSDLRAVTAGGNYGSDSAASFSPDGSRIAFTSTRTQSPDLSDALSAVYTARPDGSDVELVSNPEVVAFVRGWAPDGARVLFSEMEPSGEPTWNLTYSALPDGSDRQVVQDGDAVTTLLRVSPDGRYATWTTPSLGTAMVDLRTGAAEAIGPPGIGGGQFEEGEPATFRVGGIDYRGGGTQNYYDIALDRPGHPHTRLSASVPFGPQQPDGPRPLSSPLPPAVFTFVDPYPPFQGGLLPQDPWAGEGRGVARAAPARRDPPLAYTALALAGLRSVSYSLGRRVGHGRCSYFTGRRFLIHGRCGHDHFRRVRSPAAWRSSWKYLPHGAYEVRFRAVDRRGRTSHSQRRIVRL